MFRAARAGRLHFQKIKDGTVDRQIVYPGSIPLDTDLLNVQRNTMIALGYLAQAVLGTGLVADGLACTPSVPASMSVAVGPGSLATMQTVDVSAFGSLGTDTDPVMKLAVNTQPVSFTLSAPGGVGQAMVYLIQASFSETDANPVVLPYYNAANPALPFSGPANAGTAQNTQRLQRVALQAKAGVPAPAGSQVTPSADPGWVGLYAVTVSYGQGSLTAGAIQQIPTAPFLRQKLPGLMPGYRNMAFFGPGGSQWWVAPPGVTVVKLRLWGGGGAGGAGNGGAGGGGAGGGALEGFVSVTPGTSYPVTVGAGGTNGGPGGTSSFGTIASVTGGGAGSPGSAGGAGNGAGYGAVGLAYGPGTGTVGGVGQNALATSGIWISGAGGAARVAAGAPSAMAASGGSAAGTAGVLAGSGGSGGLGTGPGGNGADGIVIVEW